MRILALIPARGGSKRVPKKNIRLLGGRPLINWSIDAAKNHPDICEILISTDSIEIANICKKEGAYVPWLRPNNLATDEAGSVAVSLHALDMYEAEKGPVDGLLLLQPTSPFRSRETIKRGIELYASNNYQAILGVSPSPLHPLWMLSIQDNYLVPYMGGGCLEVRSQDLPCVYAVNGGFYLISPAQLRAHRSFSKGKVIPLITESLLETLDIDTESDFLFAQHIASCFYVD